MPFKPTKFNPLAEAIATMFGSTSRNERLEYDTFAISYNPATDQGPETAIHADDKFYILLGDHRQEYLDIGDNLPSCMAYFQANIQQASPWSDFL